MTQWHVRSFMDRWAGAIGACGSSCTIHRTVVHSTVTQDNGMMKNRYESVAQKKWGISDESRMNNRRMTRDGNGKCDSRNCQQVSYCQVEYMRNFRQQKKVGSSRRIYQTICSFKGDIERSKEGLEPFRSIKPLYILLTFGTRFFFVYRWDQSGLDTAGRDKPQENLWLWRDSKYILTSPTLTHQKGPKTKKAKQTPQLELQRTNLPRTRGFCF